MYVGESVVSHGSRGPLVLLRSMPGPGLQGGGGGGMANGPGLQGGGGGSMANGSGHGLSGTGDAVVGPVCCVII